MRTLTVNIKDNADAQAIADAMRLLKGVEKVSIVNAPMRRMTIEEYREMANEALVAAREGRVTSHEDLKSDMAQW